MTVNTIAQGTGLACNVRVFFVDLVIASPNMPPKQTEVEIYDSDLMSVECIAPPGYAAGTQVKVCVCVHPLVCLYDAPHTAFLLQVDAMYMGKSCIGEDVELRYTYTLTPKEMEEIILETFERLKNTLRALEAKSRERAMGFWQKEHELVECLENCLVDAAVRCYGTSCPGPSSVCFRQLYRLLNQRRRLRRLFQRVVRIIILLRGWQARAAARV